MYAIVVTGAKQYRVEQGTTLEVEKLPGKAGASAELEVVFIADGSRILSSPDELGEAKVFATITEQFKGDKQLIFKFRKRKGYKRLKGHRQQLTRLVVESISLDGKAPLPRKKATGDLQATASSAAKTVDEASSAVTADTSPAQGSGGSTSKDTPKGSARATAQGKGARKSRAKAGSDQADAARTGEADGTSKDANVQPAAKSKGTKSGPKAADTEATHKTRAGARKSSAAVRQSKGAASDGEPALSPAENAADAAPSPELPARKRAGKSVSDQAAGKDTALDGSELDADKEQGSATAASRKSKTAQAKENDARKDA
ncbi:MAG: 50S ribosomal protein L21 [Coriobacteriales bacterium]|jgi:large subunit ribosomal protein L21|nr:50S ribosomal protein L21 [Coriobacteriales bacterium]